MSLLRRFVSAVDTINEWVGNHALYLIPLLMLVIVYEVVVRYIFNKPTKWGLETSQFIFCASIALAGGYTLLLRRHVNVDILYNRWKPKVKAIADIVTGPVLLYFVGILLKLTVEATIDSYRYWERAASFWRPPLFPIYTIMTIGVALVFLQGFAQLIANIITLITGVPVSRKQKEEH